MLTLLTSHFLCHLFYVDPYFWKKLLWSFSFCYLNISSLCQDALQGECLLEKSKREIQRNKARAQLRLPHSTFVLRGGFCTTSGGVWTGLTRSLRSVSTSPGLWASTEQLRFPSLSASETLGYVLGAGSTKAAGATLEDQLRNPEAAQAHLPFQRQRLARAHQPPCTGPSIH